MTYLVLPKRLAGLLTRSSKPLRIRPFASASRMSATLDSSTVSKMTQKEKEITGQDESVQGGPTAQAQKHAGEQITSSVMSDITKGEKKITGHDGNVPGGPAAAAQSLATKVCDSCPSSVAC
jgi:hypothetical protein